MDQRVRACMTCSCRGPEFGSQTLCQPAHNHLLISPPGDLMLLFGLHRQVHTPIQKHIIIKKSSEEISSNNIIYSLVASISFINPQNTNTSDIEVVVLTCSLFVLLLNSFYNLGMILWAVYFFPLPARAYVLGYENSSCGSVSKVPSGFQYCSWSDHGQNRDKVGWIRTKSKDHADVCYTYRNK